MPMHQRRCSACGKLGHTVTKCTSKAAAVIRALKAKIYRQPMKKFKAARTTPQRHGCSKARARKMYTKREQPPRVKLARRHHLADYKGTGLYSGLAPDPLVSLGRLQDAGYVGATPKKCEACGCGSVTSTVYKRTGHVFHRCTRYGCRYSMNALSNSPFSGTKLNPSKLFMAIHMYTNTDSICPPAVDDVAAHCEGGRAAVGKVIGILRAAEIKRAKLGNRRGQVSGDVEIDEHGVRSFHVSKNNPNFQKYVTEKLLQKNYPYYLNYVRVAGIRVRGGGKVHLAMLPPVLLPPRSKPPPISNAELLSSRLLKRCAAKSTLIHSDGAQAYPAVIKKFFPRLKTSSVSHSNMEFVKKIAPVKLRGRMSSSMTGTQAIDSTWTTLDDTIPKELHTKANHNLNPRVVDYIYCWLYRVNHRNVDGLRTLGHHMS